MNLAALQHLIRSAHTLAEGVPQLVLGSASLLASFPSLGDPQGPLASTFDAGLCPEPCDGLTSELHTAGQLYPMIVRERIDLLPIPVELMPRILDVYRSIFGS